MDTPPPVPVDSDSPHALSTNIGGQVTVGSQESGRVFMCHSSRDATLAQEIVRVLDGAGIPTWIAPRDVVSGENYPGQLMRAIAGSDVFAILVTQNACASDHVLRELEQASKQRRTILPIVVGDAHSEDIDYYLGAVHQITGTPEEVAGLTLEYFRAHGAHRSPRSESSTAAAEAQPARNTHERPGNSQPSRLTVGVIPFPPFSDYSEADDGTSARGFYIEMLQEFAEQAGISVEYRPITNDDTVRLLDSGEVDLVASLYRTPRRMQHFTFAACFFASTVGAVTRADDARFRTQGDLMQPDVRIAVCQGEIGSELAQDMFGAKRGSRRLIEVDTVEVANIAGLVAAGIADVAITDNITCQKLVERSGDGLQHLFADFPLFVGHIGLVLPQSGEALKAYLDTSLGTLRREEKWRQAEAALLEGHKGVLQPL